MKSKFWVLAQYNDMDFAMFLQRNPDPKQIIAQIMMNKKYMEDIANTYHRSMMVLFVKDFGEAEKNRCMAKAFEAGFSSKNTVSWFVEAEWSSTFPPEVSIVPLPKEEIKIEQ